METLSCHSNQNSYPTEIKNINFEDGNVLCKYAKFQLHPLMVREKKSFEYFFENLPFMAPRHPIKLGDFWKKVIWNMKDY